MPQTSPTGIALQGFDRLGPETFKTMVLSVWPLALNQFGLIESPLCAFHCHTTCQPPSTDAIAELHAIEGQLNDLLVTAAGDITMPTFVTPTNLLLSQPSHLLSLSSTISAHLSPMPF